MVGQDKGVPSLDEGNEANPPSKRPKEEESSQGASELKSGQSLVGDVTAAQAEPTREDETVDDDRGTCGCINAHQKPGHLDINATPVEDALAKSEAAVQ
ncbi:hypothetical protein EJB05_19890 [Eragrostis curvula]|uniref:Uncharacterized protein n=1 Tax=Eragrostis curvula TaxID=38414 RepID=A0A5J9UX94_9POAL|nr:hypothetical protein EJB05_19890 [Eragrostis curvula]